MDTEKKQVALLAVLTLVIVGLAFFSVKWLTRGNSYSTSTVTTASIPPLTDTKAATQQAQAIASLQSATSFVWADYVPLSTAPYTRKEFYIYRGSKSTKLASKNGTLSDVFTAKGIIYFVVDDKRIFQYNPESGVETSVVDATKKVSLLAVSPDATKIAFGESSVNTAADTETITLKIWDKIGRSLTEVATLKPTLGPYYSYTSLVWSQTYNQLYVVQQGGDGGDAYSAIYQVNQTTKEVSEIGNYQSTAEGENRFLGFDAKGDTFFVRSVSGGSQATESIVKRVTVSGLTEEVVFSATDPKQIADQQFTAGPDGTPLLMSNNNVDASDVSADALGFFSITEGKATRLTPGIGLDFSDAAAQPLIRGANDKSYVFGAPDKGNYRLYLADFATKKSTLIHSVPGVGESSDVVFFRGWVK